MMAAGRSAVVLFLVLLLVSEVHPGQNHTDAPARVCAGLGFSVQCDEDGWIRLNTNACMKLFLTPQSFDQAEDQCCSEGGSLVSVHSKYEYVKLLCLLWRTSKTRMRPSWIGLRKEKKSKMYRWSDETKLNFSRWYKKSAKRHERACVRMNYGDWGRWSDVKCSQKMAFVCMKGI